MLKKIAVRVSENDYEFLRSVSKGKGEITWHIRQAMDDYVRKYKKTHGMANQCAVCGSEISEGDHTCKRCQEKWG